MDSTLQNKLQAILDVDDPNNYDCSDSACESICEEFDELTDSEHHAVCEIVEEWYERGVSDDEDDNEECE